jgi:MFS family permease
MAPNVLSIIGTTYSGPARVKAISVYGMVMGVAAVGGQLLGGVLIAANVAGLGWRASRQAATPTGTLGAGPGASGLTLPGLLGGGRVRLAVIPGTEAATAVHDGPFEDAARPASRSAGPSSAPAPLSRPG